MILKKTITLFFALFLMLSDSALAGVIKPGAIHFKVQGSLDSFQWAPDDYSEPLKQNPFRYDIFYYIPRSIQNHENVKALVFNHGGGASTMNRDGSIHAVRNYTGDLVRLADELGFVAVLPSSNGLNWGGHTVPLLRALVGLMRTELNVDPDQIGLSGHSMGGMGITRNYIWLADQFAFFMPQAAGIAFEKFKNESSIEEHLNKAFNVSYIHLQGTRDHFQEFVSRAKTHQAYMTSLESKYRRKSGFQLHLYDTDHQYQYEVFKDRLSKAFQRKRNLYQKELCGSILLQDQYITENGIKFHHKGSSRYFWVQAITGNRKTPERLNLRARIDQNRIKIELDPVFSNTILSKKLRLFFRHGMVDFNSRITVFINGKPVWVREPGKPAGRVQSMDRTDPGFAFEMAIDVPIPEESPASIIARRFARSWGLSY